MSAPGGSPFEVDRNCPDWIKSKRKAALVRLDRDRWHHRAGDDHFARPQPLAEGREHIRNMAHNVDPAAGVGLRIDGARELGATADNAAGETIGRTARARRRYASKH